MLSPSDVNREADFTIGDLRVSPAARQVEAGGQSLSVEPRVMQVLLLLARQPNEVVTRETLFAEVWGNAMVGDDSLNRAVAGVRKAVSLDPARLSLETIPRTGYRLIVDSPQPFGKLGEGPHRLTRRSAAAGALAVAGLAGFGLYRQQTSGQRHFEALVERSEKALRYGDPSRNPAELLQQAVRLRPDDARANGLLAYALAIAGGDQTSGSVRVASADQVALAALAIDPENADARLAELFVRRTSMDLAATEMELQSILRKAPENILALKSYWNLLQCVGRSREALGLVRRALKIDASAATAHYPLAQLLWITGHTAEADRVIDQAIRFWPDHRFIRFARFILLAFTDRPRAALAMLDGRGTAPQIFSAESIALWRISLDALDKRTPAAVERAKTANVERASSNFQLINQAVMVLATLGAVDEAFGLLNAYFVVPERPDKTLPASSVAFRFAPWLFIPPTAALRADPRFLALCDAIGLTAYWSRQHVRPDDRLG